MLLAKIWGRRYGVVIRFLANVEHSFHLEAIRVDWKAGGYVRSLLISDTRWLSTVKLCSSPSQRTWQYTYIFIWSWWRHQMKTFSVLLALCAENSPVNGELPSQTPMTRSFYALLDLRLNKRLSKQWRSRWFDTPSRLLWRHCDASQNIVFTYRHSLHKYDVDSLFRIRKHHICCELKPVWTVFKTH